MKENMIYLKLDVKGFHSYYVNRFAVLCFKKLRNLKISSNLESQVFVSRRRERFTLLRSPHVDKKARDQFERVTHKRMLLIKVVLKQNVALNLYRFIQNLSVLSIGVSLKVRYKILKL